LSHMKSMIMHAAWRTLLNHEFVKAYQHGIPMLCADGHWCHVYFQIFVYCADYPEKMLIATIHTLGEMPCM
ncbi:hypothetical protein DACRYDRAFT_44756, partial [Dacryopinax primogenitus]